MKTHEGIHVEKEPWNTEIPQSNGRNMPGIYASQPSNIFP